VAGGMTRMTGIFVTFVAQVVNLCLPVAQAFNLWSSRSTGFQPVPPLPSFRKIAT